jgi:hypothetical protein
MDVGYTSQADLPNFLSLSPSLSPSFNSIPISGISRQSVTEITANLPDCFHASCVANVLSVQCTVLNDLFASKVATTSDSEWVGSELGCVGQLAIQPACRSLSNAWTVPLKRYLPTGLTQLLSLCSARLCQLSPQPPPPPELGRQHVGPNH